MTCILVIDGRNYGKRLKCYYLKNAEHFLKFLLHFQNLNKILVILKKKMSFIAKIFCKLLTLSYAVTSMPLSSCFPTHFTSKPFRWSQTLLEPALQHHHHNFALTLDKYSWKRSPLVRTKVLGLFGYTLTADHMYSRHKWEK